MEVRRVVVLIVALVLAGFAALASYVFLQGTQDRANRGAVLVPVLRISKAVPKGLPGERALSEAFVVTDKVPAKFRPDNAVLRGDAIKGKVALVPLSANLVLVEGLFVDPHIARVTNSERIPAGHVAVSVAIEGVRGLSGLVTAGDRVNIMATRRGLLVDQTSHDVLAVLYQNVEVLFVGNLPASAPDEAQTPTTRAPSGNGIITFSVPQEAAERIVFASRTEGGLYLTLVPPSYQPVPVPPVGDFNLFGPPCEGPGVPPGCVPLTPSVSATTSPPVQG